MFIEKKPGGGRGRKASKYAAAANVVREKADDIRNAVRGAEQGQALFLELSELGLEGASPISGKFELGETVVEPNVYGDTRCAWHPIAFALHAVGVRGIGRTSMINGTKLFSVIDPTLSETAPAAEESAEPESEAPETESDDSDDDDSDE